MTEVKPGDIVLLKSGGQPLTVAEVTGDSAVCLWLGEEGDLFRETLPLVVLERAIIEDEDEEDADDENGDDDEDEDDEDEDDDEKRVA
jgi:hypothetical protein